MSASTINPAPSTPPPIAAILVILFHAIKDNTRGIAGCGERD